MMMFIFLVSLSGQWWIGGRKVSGIFYWIGITIGRVPEFEKSGSHWHKDHGAGSESDCIHFITNGVDGWDNGWQSHSSLGDECNNLKQFVCEKLF